MLSTATVTSRSSLAEYDNEIILAAYRVVGCYTARHGPGKAERLCRLLDALVTTCEASQAAYERYRVEYGHNEHRVSDNDGCRAQISDGHNPDTPADTKPAIQDMQPYAGGR